MSKITSTLPSHVSMLSLYAIVASVAGIGLFLISTQAAHAQYGGGGAQAATKEQLAQCERLGINPGECNENTILAKQRVTAAEQNPSTGSGTPYLQGVETWAVIGALGAIFGGVAAAFFFKGRGSKPVAT